MGQKEGQKDERGEWVMRGNEKHASDKTIREDMRVNIGSTPIVRAFKKKWLLSLRPLPSIRLPLFNSQCAIH